MTVDLTPGVSVSSPPGNLGRGMAFVAAPASFLRTHFSSNRFVLSAPFASRIFASGESQMPDRSRFVTVESQREVTSVTFGAFSFCKGTIAMSEATHVASDADVRADLARALALPARPADASRKQSNVNHSALLDGADVGPLVEKACAEAGGQQAFATRLGVSRAFINAVVHGHRPPSAAILAALGLRKVVVVRYAPVKGGAA